MYWKVKFVSEESTEIRAMNGGGESWINAETGKVILFAINASVISGELVVAKGLKVTMINS